MQMFEFKAPNEYPDGKYYVFKIKDDGDVGELVTDATVIRAQDVFSAAALEAYSHSITVAIDTMRHLIPSELEDTVVGDKMFAQLSRLQHVANYFNERAEQARQAWPKKLPD